MPLGLALLAPAGRASANFLRTASAVDASIRQDFAVQVGTLATAADRGEASWAAVAAKAEERMGVYESARALTRADAAEGLIAQGLPRFGTLGTVATWGGRAVGAAAIVSDVFTFLHPDDTGAVGTVDRGMAAANAAATAAIYTGMGHAVTGLWAAGEPTWPGPPRPRPAGAAGFARPAPVPPRRRRSRRAGEVDRRALEQLDPGSELLEVDAWGEAGAPAGPVGAVGGCR